MSKTTEAAPKTARRKSASRAPVTVSSSGARLLLDDRILRCRPVRGTGNQLTLEILSRDGEEESFLRQLSNDHHYRLLSYAHGYDAGQVRIDSCAHQSDERGVLWTLKATISRHSSGSWISPDEAEQRIRHLLLGASAENPQDGAFQAAIWGSRGTSAERQSQGLFASVWEEMASNRREFLHAAFLHAVYRLRVDGLCVDVLHLKLGPVSNKVLRMHSKDASHRACRVHKNLKSKVIVRCHPPSKLPSERRAGTNEQGSRSLLMDATNPPPSTASISEAQQESDEPRNDVPEVVAHLRRAREHGWLGQLRKSPPFRSHPEFDQQAEEALLTPEHALDTFLLTCLLSDPSPEATQNRCKTSLGVARRSQERAKQHLQEVEARLADLSVIEELANERRSLELEVNAANRQLEDMSAMLDEIVEWSEMRGMQTGTFMDAMSDFFFVTNSAIHNILTLNNRTSKYHSRYAEYEHLRSEHQMVLQQHHETVHQNQGLKRRIRTITKNKKRDVDPDLGNAQLEAHQSVEEDAKNPQVIDKTVCPKCHISRRQVKDGLTKGGSQRFRCLDCATRYTTRPMQQGHPVELKQQALQLYQEGLSLRRI